MDGRKWTDGIGLTGLTKKMALLKGSAFRR